MSMISLKCPSCGAPVELGFGKTRGYCEYCGMMVKEEMSEAEAARSERNGEFLEAVKASMSCIESNDYESAIKYADKAMESLSTDPAPSLIKFVAYLDSDLKKARSAYSVGHNLLDQRQSVAMDDDQYRSVLNAFVRNYLAARAKDINRSFLALRKMGPDDLQNIRNYEYRKKIEDYLGFPEVKEAMCQAASDCIDECEGNLKLSGSLDAGSWTSLKGARDRDVFRVLSTVFIDPTVAPRVTNYVQRYVDGMGLKWESMAKSGQINASKDQIKTYRYESEVCLKWLRKYY